MSEHGRVMTPEQVTLWTVGENQARFRGALLLPKMFFEMAENDGRGGRPSWLYYGDFVYNISGKYHRSRHYDNSYSN